MIDTGDFRLSADERVRQARSPEVFPRLAKVDPPEMLRGAAKGASRREAGSREATAKERTSPGGAVPGPKRKGHEGREEPEVYRSDEARQESLLYLVEDDADQALALAAELEAYGFEVRRFGSFQEAREALAAKRPQALIMDMMLPEGALGGARGLAELRQTGAADVPVIFLSARTDMAARLEAVRAGAQAYFAKPPDLALLVDREFRGKRFVRAAMLLPWIVPTSLSALVFY
ncbi:MAG: response regulator, partial [Planctomycetota bacterium]